MSITAFLPQQYLLISDMMDFFESDVMFGERIAFARHRT